jgi:glyoxylase-like metal-dependent hydrolase (beta-lactamase superfamily II)
VATQWREVGGGNFALTGGSNIGVIVREGRAVIVDAGLDKDAAKKALRAVADVGAQAAALVITHGHADHFGGAGWLAQQAGIPVYAPPLEAVFAIQPLLEPLFLYGGAAPIAELQGKFTLARQGVETSVPLGPGAQEIAGIRLEIIPLPGHAPQQIGIGAGETCYCGDVIFPEETLKRHPILFCADMDAWLSTLERLHTLSYTWYVPGHGEPLLGIAPLAERNAARLREIRAWVWESLTTPQEAHSILRDIAARYGITFVAPQFFLLALTTIHAALTSLQTAGEAVVEMNENRMVWRRT